MSSNGEAGSKATLEFPKGSVQTFEGLRENTVLYMVVMFSQTGRLVSSTLITDPGFFHIPHT